MAYLMSQFIVGKRINSCYALVKKKVILLLETEVIVHAVMQILKQNTKEIKNI